MKLTVIVHPNAKKLRLEKDLLGDLHVYVYEPPLQGRANREVLEVLADYLKIKKHQITLIRGEKSKIKTFEIHPAP